MNKDKTISVVVQEKRCYGCELCMNICPQNAISLFYDVDGFIKPRVDGEKCVNCGRCSNVCIANKYIKESEYMCDYYYTSLVEKEKLMNSTSGGAAYDLYRNFILKFNGVVYGVSYNHESLPEYKRATSTNEIEKYQGTKYAQALKRDIYQQIQKDLNEKNKVLFIGTPCEVAAVKRFVKDNSLLYTVQLICMGVTSPQMFKKMIGEQVGDRVDVIHERYKRKKWNKQYLYLESQNHSYLKPFELSDYSFIFKWVGRETCYNCQYKGENRMADISIGDFWGVKSYVKDINPLGMSLVSCHTKREGISSNHLIINI